VNIPFCDLARVYEARKPIIDEAVQRVLASGKYILGEEGKAFEQEFAAFLGGGFAAGCANGTEAITLALWALGLKPGQKVIVPALTAVPTAAAVILAGGVPLFADVDINTGLLDPAALDPNVLKGVAGIIAVHLYGQMCDMRALRQLADNHHLWLLEDCAQAHGATQHQKIAGTFGDIAAFSFYPTKNLGAFGDAGLVYSTNENLIEQVRKLRNYGETSRFNNEIYGINSRLDEVQAAILRGKLPTLRRDNQRRRQLARIYDEILQYSNIAPLQVLPGNEHVWHLFVVRHAQRDRLMELLAAEGIGTSIHYPLPVPAQPAYRRYGYAPGKFPAAEQLCSEIFSLPLYPELTEEEVAMVGEILSRKADEFRNSSD
jgi:dTDP-4-amino-4,6-dideoxygalactose transaminase